MAARVASGRVDPWVRVNFMLRLSRILLLYSAWFALYPVRVVTQETTAVTGTVLDTSGQPIGAALVFIDQGLAFSYTDAAGVFRIEAVPNGAHILSYRREGYAPRSFNISLAGGLRELGWTTLQIGSSPTASIRGSIVERIGGSPLPGTLVELNGERIAVADSIGSFDVLGVQVRWGSNVLTVRHSSFSNVEAIDEFWVSDPDETLEFAASLDVPAVALPGIDVEATRVVPARLRGFYERMEDGVGIFLTREQIEERVPRRVTDLFPRFRAMSRSRAANSFGLAATPECLAPLIFLDGHLLGSESRVIFIDDRMQPNISDFVHPDDVEAVEIYDTVASVPAVFAMSGSGCGVIAIWTR